MAEHTAIEWCDATFNPWIGCTRVSPACDDCYAARSTPARTLGIEWGAGQPRRRTADDTWAGPRRWAKTMPARLGRRPRVFCSSLADWLDNEVPIEWLVDLLDLIRCTPELDWLLLSKRIGNFRGRLEDARSWCTQHDKLELACFIREWYQGYAPANAWLGATVVNQAEADRDIPKLLVVPATVHFLSMEPLLGQVKIREHWLMHHHPGDAAIDWLICGGESGPKARPMHPDWARSLRDQCAAAGTAFLFKQWGEWLPWAHFSDAAIDDPPEQTRFETREFVDGIWQDVGRPDYWATMDGEIDDEQCVGRVGKKAAGRLLDGRTHDGFPEP